MKIPFVDLHAQYLGIKEEIDAAISDVIAQSSYIRGPQVDAFEKAWADALGMKHCISCANGTDAIYIAMRALQIQPDYDVITTAHTCIAPSETTTQAGGHAFFCDTDDETFTIEPKQIEQRITNRTVGIIPVHLYGQSADTDRSCDCAEAQVMGDQTVPGAPRPLQRKTGRHLRRRRHVFILPWKKSRRLR
jgi:dTDP-4-amino-4,6-dideoxygalactose transaminase